MKQAVITPIVTLIVGFILGLLGDPIKRSISEKLEPSKS
jgi:hypothetical protein